MSSDGYANRLSKYPNKGICGLPETIDSKRALDRKVQRLIKMIKKARHVVVLTGAGISTSAGIPDFRGPNGIWTKEKIRVKKLERDMKQRTSSEQAASQDTPEPYILGDNRKSESDMDEGKAGRKRRRTDEKGSAVRVKPEVTEKNQISFDAAMPTLTHRAITKLAEEDIIKYCVTQNVDGLHRRSGLPRSKHSVLHGCIFTEKCEICETEYFRDYDVGGLSFQKTGRVCTDTKCGGNLRDTILDWEDELPEKDWLISQEEFSKSDLCICLGTSLRIEPAGSLPTRAQRFVIVNKQTTPYDIEADFSIRAPVDDVLAKILLGFELQLSDQNLEDTDLKETNYSK